MLNIMCQEWGAMFFLPSNKFMSDNESMIAYTGLTMMKSGTRTSLADSKVRYQIWFKAVSIAKGARNAN